MHAISEGLVKEDECESCGAKKGQPHIITEETPDEDELREMVFDSVVTATDGCEVEPDGTCPHGHRSWLLVLGMI